jgi:hypothetical protein
VGAGGEHAMEGNMKLQMALGCFVPQFTFCKCVLALLLIAAGGLAQGTFQNLDFESAQIPSGTRPGSGASINSAFPGWTPSVAFYDGASLGGAAICIIDQLNAGDKPLQGSYSAYLFGGSDPFQGPTSMTISQTGLVPNGTTSLLMDVYAWFSFTVSLGGQPVNMVPLQTFPSYTLYGGDISAFAGQTAKLSITAPPAPYGMVNPNGVLLDDIRFATIPEPSVLAICALGALLLGRRVLERRRCQSN